MPEKPLTVLLSSSPDEEPVWYRAALESAGAILRGGYCPAPDLGCDGLLLCGGGDVESTLFGQENNGSNPPDRPRDTAELALVHAFMAAGKPILGVCRGMQLLNVALGGDIIQDLPPEVRLFHGGGTHYLSHPVRAAEGSLFHRLYGPTFCVNSFHHQAVDRLGRELTPVLWSESGIVEGFVHERLPIIGTQFHPERMTGPKRRPEQADGMPIIRYFLSLCRGQ